MLRLQTSTLGPLGVVLRPIGGADEAACGEGGLAAALGLLRRLLAPESALRPEHLEEVSVSDFDRVLAACFRWLYGERLDCRIACTACGEALEFAVTLADLMAPGEDVGAVADTAPGWFRMPDGRRFRLPRVDEVLAGLSPVDLAAGCAEGAWQDGELDRAMAAVGPLGADTIRTECPECDAAQSARLDLAQYMMRMLARERTFLHREVHLLAWSYRWSHGEIMALPREERRAFVRLIDAEAAARQRAQRRIA